MGKGAGERGLARSSSQASEASDVSGGLSDAGGESRIKTDADQQQDVLESTPALQTAIFELLYIGQQERVDGNYWVAFLKLGIDFLQLLLMLLQPQFRWDINTDLWIWKAMNWVAFFPSQIVLKSYELYTGVVIFVTALMLVAGFGTVRLGWCFKNNVTPSALLLVCLRVHMMVFVQTYYVAVMSLFMVSLNCRAAGSIPKNQKHGTLGAYPDIKCWTSPGLAYLVVSTIMSMMLVMTSNLLALTEPERDPSCRRILATAGVACEVRAVVAKTLLVVVVGTLHGYKKPQSVLVVLITFFLAWIYFKRMPHLNQWINHLRVGLYTIVFLVGSLQVGMAFHREQALLEAITVWMWRMFAPAGVFGFAMSWLRHWTLRRALHRAFSRQPTSGEKVQVYEFADVGEVEFAMRVVRRWVKGERHVLDPLAVKEAEAMMKVGLAQFPTTARMTLLNSNFLICITENYHAGFSQTQAAKKQSPSPVDIFTIFVREQEHLIASATRKGTGGSLDLASYVEFQRSHRMALQSHKTALLAVRQYWRTLLHPVVSFRALSGLVSQATVARGLAEKTYRSVLERYPKSSKLMRGYAHFLEDVHNDPWSAARFYKQADKLDEESHAAQSTMLQMTSIGDGGPVDEKNSAILVFTAVGVIQMINKVTADLFGWRKTDLEGKNVAMLLPPPYSLVAYIKSFAETEKTLQVVQMVGQHSAKYVFGIDLYVSKVSGNGDDATYMAVMKPVPSEPGVVKVWAMLGGAVCHVDAQFRDAFGSAAQDQIGQPAALMAADSAVLAQLEVSAMEALAKTTVEGQVLASATDVRMLHKYRDPVLMDVSVKLGGPEVSRVLVFSFLRKDAADLLMVTDHRGRLLHLTSGLATLLRHSAGALVAANTLVGALLPQPWAQLMFPQWMRDAALASGRGGNGQGGAGDGGAVRGGHLVQLLTANKQLVTARLNVTTLEESGENPTLVIVVHKSTVEAGLDLRRLRVQVDSTGVVLSVSESPPWLFGFLPSTLVGRNIRAFVDVMRPTTASSNSAAPTARSAATLVSQKSALDSLDLQSLDVPAVHGVTFSAAPDASYTTEQVLLRLSELAMENPGGSWRMGVHPPADESNLSTMTTLAQGMLAKQTRPAVMQITVADTSEGADGLGGATAHAAVMTLHLWRADTLCGVVEVDSKKGAVTRVVDHVVNPTGLVWGKPTQSLVGQPFASLLDSPTLGSVAKLLSLDDGRKGGGIKTAQQASARVGPVRQVASRHADGGELVLSVQAVGKAGQGDSRSVFLVVRLALATRGEPAAFLSQLFAVRAMFPVMSMMSRVTDAPLRSEAGGSAAPPARTSGTPQTHWESLPGAPIESPPPPPPPKPLTPPTAPGVSFAADQTMALEVAITVAAAAASGGAVLPQPGADVRPVTADRNVPDAVAAPQRGESLDVADPTVLLLAPAARLSTNEAAQEETDAHEPRGGDEEGGGSLIDDAEKRRSMARVQEWASVSPAFGEAPDIVAMVVKHAHVAHNGTYGGSYSTPHEERYPAQTLPKGALHAHEDRTDRSVASSEDESEHVHHQQSNNYAASEVGSDVQSRRSDTEAALDYRRGRRFHKLSRMLGAGMAQAATWRLRWHTIAIWTIILLMCTAAFVTVTLAINDQITFIDDMLSASYGIKSMIRIATMTRALSNLYTGTPNILYGKPLIPAGIGLLHAALVELRATHTGVYMGFNSYQKALPAAYGLLDIWEKPVRQVKIKYDTKPLPSYGVVPYGLWVEGNMYISAGNEIVQNAPSWAIQKIVLSSRPEFYYVVNNGPPNMFDGYRMTLDGFARRAADSTGNVNQLQIQLLIVQGCIVCLLATLYASWLLHCVAEQRYRQFSVFLAVPAGFVRALAAKQVRLDDDSENDTDVDINDLPGGAGASSAPSVGATAESRADGGDGTGAKRHRWRTVWAGLVNWVVFWSPLLVAGGKRRLLRDGRDTFWLIMPYLLWAALIIGMYIAGYIILGSMLQPIQGLNLINAVRVRMLLVYYWAHEAASVNGIDQAAYATAMAGLTINTATLNAGYQFVLFGAESSPSLANNPLYSHLTKGIPFYSQAAQDIFFETGVCLMIPAASCKLPSSPYYAVSRAGLDAMMQRFILEAINLSKDNITDVNLNSTRLAYIFSLGTADIYQGFVDQAELARNNVISYYSQVKTLQMAVFIIAWFYAAIYLIVVMRTYIFKVAREARQVADLLSQLPKDVDVEGLIRKMVLQAYSGGKAADGGRAADAASLPLEERPLLAGSVTTGEGGGLKQLFSAGSSLGKPPAAAGSGRHRFSATNKVSPLLQAESSETSE